jgi:hypothetical protein
MADERRFRIETERPVVAMGCFVVGRGVIDFISNELADDPVKGIGAIRPKCRPCRKPTNDGLFAFCGRSLFCRACGFRARQKMQLSSIFGSKSPAGLRFNS